MKFIWKYSPNRSHLTKSFDYAAAFSFSSGNIFQNASASALVTYAEKVLVSEI
jgi:hypothetical protein